MDGEELRSRQEVDGDAEGSLPPVLRVKKTRELDRALHGGGAHEDGGGGGVGAPWLQPRPFGVSEADFDRGEEVPPPVMGDESCGLSRRRGGPAWEHWGAR